MYEAQGESDLGFHLPVDRKKLEHDALTQIRKRSLDPYSRLHSIAEDTEFVQNVHETYSSYPLLANLRCGAWYCNSHFTGGVTAHFKSSDGHYNGWSFNLRRPNLHILPLIRDAHGLCIVDSTRSGKRMPDSLSKTVPIWCTVVNRAMKIRGMARPDDWDVELYTAPQSVSKQEHTQIESKIDGWAKSLAESSYDLPSLPKPIRPIWITPSTTALPVFDETTPFYPIICISASKMVEEGAERRRNGYSYVQGAGDDHENWSEGLTPDVFWKHRNELLNASEIDFPEVLARIVTETRCSSQSVVKDWLKQSTPIAFIGGLISISTIEDVPESVLDLWTPQEMSERLVPCIVVRVRSKSTEEGSCDDTIRTDSVYEVILPSDKKRGERAFKTCLPGCLSFIRQHISEQRAVCIVSETGNDASVGIALVALQTFFDDSGVLNLGRHDQEDLKVSKESIRSRLHWIIASRPQADPSRATMKRINEFFMSPSHRNHL